MKHIKHYNHWATPPHDDKKGKTGKTDHRDCTAGIAFQ